MTHLGLLGDLHTSFINKSIVQWSSAQYGFLLILMKNMQLKENVYGQKNKSLGMEINK